MVKPWKVILVFLGVFLAGAVCGIALAPDIWHLWHPKPPGAGGSGRINPGFNAVRMSMLDRLSKQLDLTPEQKEKIAPIIKQLETDTRQLRRESVQKFRVVIEKADADITAQLTPEQRTKFEQSRKRARERIEKLRAEFREHGPRPSPNGPKPGGPGHPEMDHGDLDHGPGDMPPPPPPDEKPDEK